MSEFYKPGDKVVRSGIYTATHKPDHALEHAVTCVFGNEFPKCIHCGDEVRFTLRWYAKDVDSDENFMLRVIREKRQT